MKALDPIRVENSVLAGTPDVNFIGGWMELKWSKEWPKREDSIVPLDHFTPQQRVFALRRWRAGGVSLVMWTVGGVWMLFDGQTAAKILGKVPRVDLEAQALRVWKPLDDEALVSYLRELAQREAGLV